jgi:hypothetical protein
MYYVFVGCVQDMSDGSFGTKETQFASSTYGIDRYWIYEIGPREGNRRKGKVVSQDAQEEIRD